MSFYLLNLIDHVDIIKRVAVECNLNAPPCYLFHLLTPPPPMSCQKKVEISSNTWGFFGAPPPLMFPAFYSTCLFLLLTHVESSTKTKKHSPAPTSLTNQFTFWKRIVVAWFWLSHYFYSSVRNHIWFTRPDSNELWFENI